MKYYCIKQHDITDCGAACLAPLLVDVIGVGASFLIVGGIAAAVSIGVLLQGRKRESC